MSSDLQKTVRLLLKEYVAPTRKEGENVLLFSELAYSRIFMGTSVGVHPPMYDVANALNEAASDVIATYSTQTKILQNGVFDKTEYLCITLI